MVRSGLTGPDVGVKISLGEVVSWARSSGN